MDTSDTSASDVERAEQAYLTEVQNRIEKALQGVDQRLNDYAQDVQDQKEHLWSSRDEMDHVEKIAARQSIEQAATAGEFVQARQHRLRKLRASPYFGRVDFRSDSAASALPVYVGIHHFHDDEQGEDVVYDWRAPIASLFYNFETGAARYEAPQGDVDGEIERKRQFRIRGGRLELMIESSVHVVDDVLQETLGQSSDDGMKNIVATIQRDQNAIIRNDEAPVLIIQGVAGSGKTSIALHRIAYLLYRFRDTLSADDILIISPNSVFADYISNVLPELGEESVAEIGMETLADELLDGQYRFQHFFEQITALLEKGDEALRERLAFKGSADFLRQLGEYAKIVEKQRFAAEDVWIARRYVPAWLIDETFRKHRRLGLKDRVKQVVVEIEQRIGIQYHYDLEPEERRELRTAIKGMVREQTLRSTYKQFFDWLGRPELFRPAGRGRLEYADIFPMIYLKMRLEGVRSRHRHVEHLVIDEMQDYTPVQYAVLAQIFRCNMTILGDASQAVSPYGATNAGMIKEAFPGASSVMLNKSYRSSYEIMQFAQRISPNPDLEPIERHGESPSVVRCRNAADEARQLRSMIDAFKASEHNTLAIIARTDRQARRLEQALTSHYPGLQRLDTQSRSFRPGVILCTAHMAKGLEFDRVIVADVSARQYISEMDRNLLYVACTRAMHRLALTHVGEPSEWLAEAST
ncbi:HelD family protein [Spiribacter vilamensis]|uniref:DNA helicase-2/ATP-dependent DNA helicase PcrA n=1 Tax=Spiribacter vilamensis TaxID=531306 RepID=A0A4Q8CZ77_9GAMM|nr:3'-5' exonuclease [Spiribacter vilamensis]RZU98309.1 DNA helicase-2/ATP-dependent DNA helicase PcrA [Spiribacter vilamensis]TVO60801.1 AAA family ATPase [Spiribacter vilamensis]